MAEKKLMDIKTLKPNIIIYFKFFLFLFLLLQIGCNGEKKSKITQEGAKTEAGTEKTQVKPSEKKIVITVNNGALEDDKLRLTEQNFINELWEKKHPNSRIQNDTWQYSNESFMVKIRGGAATDLIGLFACEGTTVIEKGYALDITDLVQKWEMYPFINKEVIEPFSRNGRIYGLPGGAFGGGGYVMTLFYNNQMFRDKKIVDEKGNPKPPNTWEEFVEVAKKLTDREKGIAGFGILGEAGGGGWHFLNWVWQAGGDFEKKINEKWVATFDSPEAIKSLQFIKDLRWKHNVLQSDLLCNNDDLFKLFTSERIAMALFTPEYLIYLVEKFHFPLENIGIVLLPAGQGGRANQMGGAYGIINPNISPKKKQLTFDLLVFDYDLEVLEARAKFLKEQGRIFGWGVLPIFKEEHQKKIDEIMDKYRTVPSQKELMAEALKYIHPEPPYFSQQLYREALGPAVQEVLTNKDADPEKILKNANKRFQERFLDKIQE